MTRRVADTPPRVVLDTNVVLSALVSRAGITAAIRQAWQRGQIVPLVSAATVQELLRVLAYPKFRLTANEQQELLADYLPCAQTVRVVTTPEVPACRDPFDVPFLQLAMAGHADVLVSGDKDLSSLSAAFAIAIVSPAEFAAWRAAR